MVSFASVKGLDDLLSIDGVALFLQCAFGFLVSLAVYVIVAGALYTIAQRRGLDKPWMALIPVGQLWLLGAISDQYQFVVRRNVSNNRKTLLWLQIVMVVLVIFALILTIVVTTLSRRIDAGEAVGSALQEHYILGLKGLVVIGLLLLTAAVLAVCCEYMALYDLYRSCDPANSVLYLLLSLFVSITMPVFLLMIYDKDLGLPQNRLYKWVKKKE